MKSHLLHENKKLKKRIDSLDAAASDSASVDLNMSLQQVEEELNSVGQQRVAVFQKSVSLLILQDLQIGYIWNSDWYL